MSIFDRIAEEKIQEALRRGEFAGLSGYGQRLDLHQNPYEPPEERLANHVLSTAGIAPHWLSERQDIEQELHTLRADIGAETSPVSRRAEWALRLHSLNRRIQAYNLGAPASALQLALLDVEKELFPAR